MVRHIFTIRVKINAIQEYIVLLMAVNEIFSKMQIVQLNSYFWFDLFSLSLSLSYHLAMAHFVRPSVVALNWKRKTKDHAIDSWIQ